MVIDVHRAALQVILTFVGIFMLQGDVLADSWGVAPDGTVWTLHSKRFQYAPTFEFAAVPGACRYVSDDHRHHTWLNCTLEVMSALGRMADLESHGEAKRAWHLE